MAQIAVANMPIVYSALAPYYARRATVWPQLCSRTYEPALQTNYQVEIPINQGGQDAASYSRGSNWRTAADIAYSDVTMVMDKAAEVGETFGWEEEKEINYPAVADIMANQALNIAENIDASISSALLSTARSGTGDATVTETKAVVAGNISDYGTATKVISKKGVPDGTDAGRMVRDALSDIAVDMGADNISGPGARLDRPIWAVMGPGAFRSLEDDLIDLGISETFSETAYARHGISMRATPGAGVKGIFRGIVILVSNQDATVDKEIGSAADNNFEHHRIIAGTWDAIEFAARPALTQVLTPATNQTGPKWMFRQIHKFGFKVVDTDFLRAARIRIDKTATT